LMRETYYVRRGKKKRRALPLRREGKKLLEGKSHRQKNLRSGEGRTKGIMQRERNLEVTGGERMAPANTTSPPGTEKRTN